MTSEPQQVDMLVMRVECVPVPKGRPRFTRTGHAFTPKKTVDFEKLIAAAWREQQGETMIETPISLYVNIGVVNMRKDLDNMVKSIADGLNNVAYKDDSQIISLHAWKYPAEKGHEHVNVIVRKHDNEH